MNDGVELILARMETHPEEFYGNVDRWKFIYSEHFRDAMSETEKGTIFDKLKEIRRQELTSKVMGVLTENMRIPDHVRKAFDIAPLASEGQSISYNARTDQYSLENNE